jgi:hypothetical protein
MESRSTTGSCGNISSGRREDTKNRWMFLPFLVLGFVRGWLPAYTDRRDIGTIDGDAVRYLGLALFISGKRTAGGGRVRARA